MKRILSCVPLAFFLGLCAVVAQAQTAPPDPFASLENGYPITISGNYSASSGNATNNGVQTTLEYRLAKHVDARVDQFGLNKPSATMLSLAEVQVKYSLAHIVKPTANFNSKPILLSFHAGPGAVKSPSGAMNFAIGAGVSIDYAVSKVMHVRVLDYTYAYSRGIGNAGISLGNYSSVGTGLGFSF